MYGLISRFTSGKIRRIILLGMIASILGFTVLGGISYWYLLQIDQALALAEIVDDLSSDILEIRRYEKNFLLYMAKEDYQETLHYCDRALANIDRIKAPESGLMNFDGQGHLALSELRQDLVFYKDTFATLENLTPLSPDRIVATDPHLRDQGKDLVDKVHDFVVYQRERIVNIIQALKYQLILAIVSFIGIATFFSWLIGRRIFGALEAIEQSARQIVQGNFESLPLPDTRDETYGVTEAFNHMIVELDRRQNQLVQEKKLASLGVLTSGIAHQLNNPLNNISTSCQILQEDLEAAQPLDPSLTRQMLNNIYQEVRRSRDIVKGLLEFTRETEFSLKLTKLNHLAQRALTLVSSEVPAGVQISCEIPEDIELPLDGQRFQEALLNLLINATQSIAPPGSVALTAYKDVDAGQVILEIQDTGKGISPEHVGRIFDPFFTLKETGTGLGLAVVFGIIKKHDGTIKVHSEPGQGTCFTITLPLFSGATK